MFWQMLCSIVKNDKYYNYPQFNRVNFKFLFFTHLQSVLPPKHFVSLKSKKHVERISYLIKRLQSLF